MFCEKCGANNHDNTQFCSNCGQPLAPTQNASAQPYVPPAQFAVPPVYAAPSNDNEHVSTGKWIGIFCINLIPCVGSLVYMIMMFVWAFGSTPAKSLKTFAKAQLILFAVVLGISIIAGIISLVTGASLFEALSSYYANY